MLPRIAGHPLSLLRCPTGIDGGGCFYQRSPGQGLGQDVHPFKFQHKGKTYGTATAIADYGVRARPRALVAVPLSWDELDGLKAANAFTMKDVPAPTAGARGRRHCHV